MVQVLSFTAMPWIYERIPMILRLAVVGDIVALGDMVEALGVRNSTRVNSKSFVFLRILFLSDCRIRQYRSFFLFSYSFSASRELFLPRHDAPASTPFAASNVTFHLVLVW